MNAPIQMGSIQITTSFFFPDPPWSPGPPPQECSCSPVWQEVHRWTPMVVQGPHPPMYYVTYPTPYYVTMHGGVMVERHSQVYRPRPVYPNRKRSMAVSELQGGGVRRALMPPESNETSEEEKTPKRNKVELDANVNQVFGEKQATRPPDPYRRALLGTPTKEKKGSIVEIVGQDILEANTSSTQPATGISYADVIRPKSYESATLIKSEGKVTLVKDEVNKVKTEETGVKGESETIISFIPFSDKSQDKLREQGKENFKNPIEPKLLLNSLNASRQKIHLEMTTLEMYTALKKYVPTKEQLKHLGYPMLFSGNPKIALIYKQAIRTFVTHKNKYQNKKKVFESNEKTCCRCGRKFYVKGVTYLTLETCQYHWGKIVTSENYKLMRACCNGDLDSEGCTQGKLHVWSGISDGLNQLKGFIKSPQGTINNSILGLDCEMIYTKAGMEVARVVLVNILGEVVYQALVRPQHEVIDYNTRFSGISLEDYIKDNNPKPFHDVQRELLKFIKSGTIVVGHALENDLRVLKMVHHLVVDTAVIYPHQEGFPYRRKLKDIAQEVLGVQLQNKESGHDPVEDAKATLALTLHKIKVDWEANKSK